jgi:hypothetical protein
VVKARYADFAALDPFFDVIQKGLAGLVDGDHYFDTGGFERQRGGAVQPTP